MSRMAAAESGCCGRIRGRIRRRIRRRSRHAWTLGRKEKGPAGSRTFCFFHLSSEYQTGSLNAPNLMADFGVEGVCFHGLLLWCGGRGLDKM